MRGPRRSTTSAVPLCAASAETATRQQAPAAPTKTQRLWQKRKRKRPGSGRRRRLCDPQVHGGTPTKVRRRRAAALPGDPRMATHGARASPDNAEVMSRWESVDDLTPFLEQQNAVPTDSFHPDVARVVKNMHLPPPGEQLSRERAGRVTGARCRPSCGSVDLRARKRPRQGMPTWCATWSMSSRAASSGPERRTTCSAATTRSRKFLRSLSL